MVATFRRRAAEIRAAPKKSRFTREERHFSRSHSALHHLNHSFEGVAEAKSPAYSESSPTKGQGTRLRGGEMALHESESVAR
jgi:hypothetical protein